MAWLRVLDAHPKISAELSTLAGWLDPLETSDDDTRTQNPCPKDVLWGRNTLLCPPLTRGCLLSSISSGTNRHSIASDSTLPWVCWSPQTTLRPLPWTHETTQTDRGSPYPALPLCCIGSSSLPRTATTATTIQKLRPQHQAHDNPLFTSSQQHYALSAARELAKRLLTQILTDCMPVDPHRRPD